MLLLFKVFKRHPKHSKTLTFVFSKMLVVHFMGPSNSFCISVIGISKYLKPLVNEYIMNGKIGNTVCQDPHAYWQGNPNIFIPPKEEEPYAYYGIEDKEKIISFPPAVMVLAVVILMKFP